MMHVAKLLSHVTLALTVIGLTLAAPSSSPKRSLGSLIMPAPNVIPSIWKQLGAASTTAPYTFTMSLVGADIPGLTTRMEQIAAAGTGAWLTDDELGQYATPSADATNAVTSYLVSQGFSQSDLAFSKYGDQITVTTTVGQTSSLFSANFLNYNFNGIQLARTKTYTIPTEIASHVQDVYPLTNFAQVKHNTVIRKKLDTNSTMAADLILANKNKKRAAPSSCNTSQVTPACLKDYYGTTSYTRSTGTSTPDVGVMGYIDQYVSQADLTSFLQSYDSAASSYQIPINLRNGATNDASNAGVEAMLDVETVTSEIYPLTASFFAEGNSQTAGDIFLLTFNDFVNNFSSTTRPKIITISYGSDESEFSSSQANSMCTAAQKLTALGTTIVVSSGDDGVTGQGDSCPAFTPTYPSGCQYILSVGATQGFSSEVMVNPSLAGFYSGAGASNIFPIPSYQSTQVAAYEKQIGTMKGYYSQTGRMFPDLAAQGSLYVIVANGETETVSGTSCSAPLTASILAMVNDKRAKAGKGTIGWGNPSLYSYGVLHDITSGGSYDCGKSTTLGFPAETGWDGASGWGSVMFSALSAAFGVS
jgi:tripeptidyl-peptidase-1